MTKISNIISRKFYHPPTAGQEKLFDVADSFLATFQKRSVLLIKGYAGTGKTSTIAAILKALPSLNYRFVLLAPTGRAAKIISQYTQRMAFTIHKKVYKAVPDPDKGGYKFKRQKNFNKNTIFIVDEASMISDERENGCNGLLQDLIDFVFEHETNKLIIMGDHAQLPPVGQRRSPALDCSYLERCFDLHVHEVELTEVVRQLATSGILQNATTIRDLIARGKREIRFSINGYEDVFRITSDNFEEHLRHAYDKYGLENTIIVCRSNRQAVKYNEYIRKVIHFYEEEIEVGDIIMIARNNYFYLDKTSRSGFLANGDFAEVRKIVRFEATYGFRFATVFLQLLDFPDEEPFEAKIMLDTLHSQMPSLPLEDSRKLYWEINKDYQHITSAKERNKAVLADPFWNALQIKYAYALTGHKSQGGQWDCVFIDHGFLTLDKVNQELQRWLYTAVTRSIHQLYLVNFLATFFKDEC